MRKKIFVIHGKGVTNGIGKEGGGDLDTVSSNAFYMVWAEGSISRDEGRPAVYGEDYEFAFLNYSEGVASLLAYPGCDIYLPDFPIDALAPRLKLLLIEDEPAIELLNRFTRETDDFRLWIVGRAGEVSEEVKEIFNAVYKQTGKVLEHQESPALEAALEVLGLTRCLVETDISLETSAAESPEASGVRQGIISHLAGNRLRALKKAVLGHLRDQSKEKMIDLLDEHDAILAFDTAVQKDMSTNGRINYTDELLVVLVETAAYLVRGYKQLASLPWDKGLGEAYSHVLGAIRDEVVLFLRTLVNLIEQGKKDLPPAAGEPAEGMLVATQALIRIFSGITAAAAPESPVDGSYPLVLLLVEEATGKAVPGVEVVIRRMTGEGSFHTGGGEILDADQAVLTTGADGAVRLKYLPSSPAEAFRLAATFDDLQELLLPPEGPGGAKEIDGGYDDGEVDVEVLEEAFEEKDAEAETGVDRAMCVSLALIERQFRALSEADVKVVSIDDHHPYTQEIFDLLGRLVEDGIIGKLQVASLPRGKELPVEQQKCGADLVYAGRVKDQPWDNPGLAELRRLAHLQDLHIELTPLGIEISKLIGSKYSKVAIAQGLASIKTREDMTGIMERLGWDRLVAAYDAALEEVYPRVEQVVGVIELARPDGEGDPIRITAALSPFCDAKKGEVQINVASAIHYLLARKKNPSDYFFYCYGSQLMTTRRPNENETSLNLSTMCQHIGTRADGGHSGAATCKPSSNPFFPRRRLEKVKDTTFLHYLDYLADRVVDYSGLTKQAIRPLEFERYSEPVEAALAHVDENLFRIKLEKADDSGEVLNVLFTRPPRVLRRQGEEKPSFFQVINYLKRTQEIDYLIFAQGMLYRVILANLGDPSRRLDLPALSRRIGWSEDGGCPLLAVADIRKNKAVKKRLRRMLPPHLIQLARLVGGMIEEDGEYRVASLEPVVTPAILETFSPVLSRLDSNVWLVELEHPGGKSLRLVAVLAGLTNRRGGEADPPIPLVAAHLAEHRPDYILYAEGEVAFPRQQGICVLARAGDSEELLDCARAVAGVAGRRYCGDAAVAEFMPALVEGSPLGRSRLTGDNYGEFLEFVVPRLAEAAGLSAGNPARIKG